jgi:peptidoglycan/xylan/chitin deacetylase (PgdA/CDA1 family)
MPTGTVSQPSPVDPSLASRIPAIEYHDSEYNGGDKVRMTTEWFLAQLQWLSDNGFKALDNEAIIQFALGNARPPQKSFILRFDLGMPIYQNVNTVIVPALEKFAFHATFYVLTSAIKDTPQANCICWSHLREWEQTGLVEIGSHGVYHPDYRKAGTATRVWDARESKRVIETKLGHPISFFAFPYDSVPNHPDLLLKLFNYRLAFAGYTRADRSVQFKDPAPFGLPCYYPYSGKKTYPIIIGTNNKLNFGQMITAAIK